MNKIRLTILFLFLSAVSFAQVTDTGDEVGIGETNPSDKLEVNKNGGGIDLTHSNSSSYSSIESFEASSSQAAIQFIGSQFNSVNRRNAFEIVNRMPSGNIDFFTENSFSVPKLRIEGNGNVGIGILSPLELLEVGGNVFVNHENSGFIIDAADYKRVGFMKYHGKAGGIWRASNQGFEIGRVSGTDITAGLGSSPTTDFYISGGGQVGIGTISTGTHKLAVEGSIGAREIKVEASGWSDFVFENSYDLRTLEEVEQHIKENGHLPEIPSETEVTENGINLGQMDAKLLQKIEELTLYMIDMNKQLKSQSARVQQLEQENSDLKEKVNSLENN